MSNPEHSSIEITLSRFDRIYRPSETVTGTVTITAKDGWSHPPLTVKAVGEATVSVRNENGGGVVVPPRNLLEDTVELAPAGRVEMGANRFPFSFALKGAAGAALLETYHGAYISVNYNLTVFLARGRMKRDLEKTVEFIVEVPVAKKSLAVPVPVPFCLTPTSLTAESIGESIGSGSSAKEIPSFKFTGSLHRSNCLMNRPLTGDITIASSSRPVASIELQLVRVESVNKSVVGRPGTDKKEYFLERTEIEALQMASGDVTRGLSVPLHMLLPRVHTCPSLSTSLFKVHFEVNLVVVFDDGYCVTENFPITLHRTE